MWNPVAEWEWLFTSRVNLPLSYFYSWYPNEFLSSASLISIHNSKQNTEREHKSKFGMNKTEEWTYYKCVYHEFFFNYPHIDSKNWSAIMENLLPNLNDSRTKICNGSLYDRPPKFTILRSKRCYFWVFRAKATSKHRGFKWQILNFPGWERNDFLGNAS